MQLQETALLVVIVIVGLPLLACDTPRIKLNCKRSNILLVVLTIGFP